MISQENTSFLAWTTTPWTLPSNLALAVNPEMEYITFVHPETGHNYIIAKNRMKEVFKLLGLRKSKKTKKAKDLKIVSKVKGSELVGQHYEPLFDYFSQKMELSAAFKVISGDFVTDQDGTGIVH